ncbi:hypothetical protein [Gemmatimonas sp.]|uniref:hypothetical protein n=1 Tax=Gemmatimonas sp. TaxID=1962908 RepID=UPI00391EEB53
MKALGRRLAGVLACLAAAGTPRAVAAQSTHVLIVSGLSGDPAFKTRFGSAVSAVRSAAATRWGVSDSSLIVLTEDSTAFNGRSTRDNIARAFAALSRRTRTGDLLHVLLVCHGSVKGAGSKVNLPGPDATASEYAAWLAPFGAQQGVFVNAATGSGDFVPVIAGSGRVVVTATRSAVEKNDAEFLQHFARALSTADADANTAGRLSALEAVRFARAEVAKSYESTNRMLTEHAVLSDSTAAARMSFGTRAATTDPRVARLLEERQALESQVAALRARKAAMEPAASEAELERLLLALAEKSAAIKAAGGGK